MLAENLSLMQKYLSFSSAHLFLGRTHLSSEYMQKMTNVDAAFMEKVFEEKNVMKQ